MAQVCSACGTDNREAAKFCRGCGARLGELAAAQRPAHWEHTQPADLLDQEQTVLIKPAAAKAIAAGEMPTVSPAAQHPRSTSADGAAGSTSAAAQSRQWPLWAGLALGLLLLGAALVIWWGSSGKHTSPPEPSAAAASPPAAPVAPAPAPASGELRQIESAQAPSSAVPTAAPALSPEPELPQPAPAPTSAATPAAPMPAASPAAPRPRPRRESTAAAAAPAPEPTPVAPAPIAPTAPVAAPAPASPEQSCGALGFFARARCMAAECAKPALSKHPQCEAVREQQRREERIRNPEGG